MTDIDKRQKSKHPNVLPGISFKSLREGRCKFPLGERFEPAERYCGEPTAPGLTYCPQCQQVAYSRPERRS